ncbi:endoribonuclease ysh1 [Coemansia erecta]|uniref:Endoribonuclease ysh1 n=1 Tax=Coemansia erecta TaxID=147472 RepID=A0A9W7XZ17_9FUNG|nr:endoribonuclease ysh1 [Coemansia erecta]
MSAIKRKAGEVVMPIEDEDDLLKITPLGAGREVGRSCIVLQYKGKTVMLDCGLHAGLNGQASLPFVDEIDPSTVDVLLVTHFHIDHAAAVPFYLEKTTFKGRTFMTRPTKGIFRWLATDYIRVTNTSNSDSTALYTEADLISAHAKIEEIDVHQQIEINGIKFTAFNAGHVLGAAMFLIEIAGVKVLYTGDYSREEDRHLVPAENPGVAINVLITESTYGVQSHQPRVEREKAFLKQVRDIVRRRGCCLLPVTALGRTQELLLILEEHWGRNTQALENVPIFFISALGKMGTHLYEAYIMHMNQRIQRQFSRTGTNPFDFKYIKTRTNLAGVPETGPCVVLASPGMLQSGVSRQLLERWAPRPENGLIITGYSVEGTLARNIVNEPEAFQALSGGNIARRLSVKNISFSAHVDYAQNSAFIDEIRAQYVVLVHGEANAMLSLRANIIDKYKNTDYEIQVFAPNNIDTVRLHFQGEKLARVIGCLANKAPREGDWTAGILVEKDFNYTLVDPADLQEFAAVAPVVIEQQLQVPYASSFTLLKHHLEQMFGSMQLTKELSNNGEKHILRIYDAIDVSHYSWKQHVEVEWQGNAMNDMVADSAVAVVLNIECSPASVKLTQSPCGHSHEHKDDADEHMHSETDHSESALDADIWTRAGGGAEMATKLAAFMEQQFSQVELSEDRKYLTVRMDSAVATVNTVSLAIETDSHVLRSRLGPIVARIHRTLRTLSHRSEPLPEPEAEPEAEVGVDVLEADSDVKDKHDSNMGGDNDNDDDLEEDVADEMKIDVDSDIDSDIGSDIMSDIDDMSDREDAGKTKADIEPKDEPSAV